MKNVLKAAISVYEENISELALQPISEQILSRYLISADNNDIERIKKLVVIVPQLAAEMLAFLEDTDRLPEDRGMAIAAINYLLMPFDIIPDDEENGIIGLMDDAVVIVEVATRIKCLSPELEELIGQCKPVVDLLRNAMNDWLGNAIDNFVNNAGNSLADL